MSMSQTRGPAVTRESEAGSEDAPQSGRCAAVVVAWHDRHGWGVLDSPETAGGCLVEFPAIATAGRRTLHVGDSVTLYWKTPGSCGWAFEASLVCLPRRASG